MRPWYNPTLCILLHNYTFYGKSGVEYLTVLCYHPYLVSLLFADLLSLNFLTLFLLL